MTRLDYDKNPMLTTDQKLKSLIDSIERSLLEIGDRLDAIDKEIKALKEES